MAIQTEIFNEKTSFCRTNRLLKGFVKALEDAKDLGELAFIWDTQKPCLEYYTQVVKDEMIEIKNELKLKLQ